MVEPLVIVTSCVSIIGGVTTLMMKIGIFVCEVKAARKDMDAVHRELSSLQLCLTALRNDEMSGRPTIPVDIQDQINQILVNIEMTVNQINDMLIKLGSGKLGRRIQWAMTEKQEMNKFRSSLESNKTALEVGLTVGTISMLMEQRSRIRDQSENIAEMSRMMTSMVVQSSDMSDKMDNVLTLQRQQLGLTDVQAALDDLKVEISALIKPSTVQHGLQDFSGQAMTHVETLLMPMNSELGHILDIPKATQAVSKDERPESSSKRYMEIDSTKSLGICVACKQDLILPETLYAMQDYQRTCKEEEDARAKRIWMGLSDVIHDESEEAARRDTDSFQKATDKKTDQVEEIVAERERTINELISRGSKPQKFSEQSTQQVLQQRKGKERSTIKMAQFEEHKPDLPVKVVGNRPVVNFLHPSDAILSLISERDDISTGLGENSIKVRGVYQEYSAQKHGLKLDMEDKELLRDIAYDDLGRVYTFGRRSSKDIFFRFKNPITLEGLQEVILCALLEASAPILREIGAQILDGHFFICVLALYERALSTEAQYCYCEYDVNHGKATDGVQSTQRVPPTQVIDFYEEFFGHKIDWGIFVLAVDKK